MTNKNNKNYNILIVDDEIEYQNVVSIILSEQGYQTFSCSNGKEALDFLENQSIDLIITDLRMPVMSGEELMAALVDRGYDGDILVVTAYGTIESAVDAIRHGATDYFVKSGDLDELILKVDRIAQVRRIEIRNENLISIQNRQEYFLETKNPELQKIMDMCSRTADTDINILLLGESGVGKEVVANYIHRCSPRAQEPFVAVNCQVFPEGIIESELFGHEKGAFTGAVESRKGKFEEANFGTLFLDEIGDLPLTTQGKLLRALETRSIERVGSNRKIDLDVRFIFATNKDITKLISEGQFRDDLYYRINTLVLTIPPLRERKEDLPKLIQFFVAKTAEDQKKKNVKIDSEVMDFLLKYDYPGNVRELRNIIERMIALSRDGVVSANDLFIPGSTSGGLDETDAGESGTLREARGVFEKKYITRILEDNRWNVEKSAHQLGITSRQLWNKIGQYKIERP